MGMGYTNTRAKDLGSKRVHSIINFHYKEDIPCTAVLRARVSVAKWAKRHDGDKDLDDLIRGIAVLPRTQLQLNLREDRKKRQKKLEFQVRVRVRLRSEEDVPFPSSPLSGPESMRL